MNKAAAEQDGQRICPEELLGMVCRHSSIAPCENIEIEGRIWNFNNPEQNSNPLAANMDGVHLNGNCRFGCITKLKGACCDDLVALNADEGSAGPIASITTENHTGSPEMPLFENRGTVKYLKADMLFADGEPVEL